MTPKNAVNVIADRRPTYNGRIHLKHMPADALQGYNSFRSAKKRSRWAGLPAPEMSSREFIAWWLTSLSSFKGSRPTCGRIDHSRGYMWDNIFMQDASENSRECAIRTKLFKKSPNQGKRLVASVDGEPVLCFRSHLEAASALCVVPATIWRMTSGKVKKSAKFIYKLEAA